MWYWPWSSVTAFKAAFAPSTSTTAPIWGTPAASRTVPDITDLSEAADIVVRADNASTINSHRDRIVFIPTTFAVLSVAGAGERLITLTSGPGLLLLPKKHRDCRLLLSTSLLDDEFRRRGNRLFRNIIAYLDGQLVSTCWNVLYWQTLLQSSLIAGGQILGLVDDGFFIGGIHNVVLHDGRRLMALLVDAEVVNLHPEVPKLLRLLERCWGSIGWLDAGTHFRGPDNEVSCGDVLGRDRLQLVRLD